MTLRSLLALGTWFLWACGAAHATPADPLWLKVIEHNKGLHGYVAQRITQTVAMSKPGESEITLTLQKQFDKWVKGKPTYRVVSTSADVAGTGSQLAPFDMAQMFADEAEAEVFSPQAPVRLTPGQSLNGMPATLAEVEQAQFKMKLWVHGSTGAIYQRSLEFALPMMLEGTMHTRYTLGPQGVTVLESADTTLKVLIPFKKLTMRIRDMYADWIAKP